MKFSRGASAPFLVYGLSMIYTLLIEVLAIQGDGFHAFVNVGIGRKHLRMLVDTGASRTVFDEQKISEIIPSERFRSIEQLSAGLGTNSAPGKSTIIPNLRLGALKLKNYETVILDLSHVNVLYRSIGLPELVGVLGSDLLLKYKAKIDFEENTLVLKTSK